MSYHNRPTLTFALLISLLVANITSATNYAEYRLSVPTFQRLREFIDNNSRIDSVDSLIQAWNGNSEFGRYREDVVTMYDSESSQSNDVSPARPRLLPFGGKLIMGLTGDPDKDGYQRIEVFEFDEETSEFRTHEITFGPRTANGRNVRVTTNPRSCVSCHGDPPRPNWGSYPLWPGAHDGLENDRYAMSTLERGMLERFCSTYRRSGRYTHFNFDATQLCRSGNRPATALKNRPAYHMSLFLARANSLRIARRIQSSHNFRYYKYALYGAMICKDDISSYLPRQIRGRHESALGKNYSALLTETRSVIQEEHDRRVARFRSLNGLGQETKGVNGIAFRNTDMEEDSRVASLRYLLEGRPPNERTDMSDWSLSYAPGGYSYNFGVSLALPQFYEGFTETHGPEIQRELGVTNTSSRSGSPTFCAALRQKSPKELGRIEGGLSNRNRQPARTQPRSQEPEH